MFYIITATYLPLVVEIERTETYLPLVVDIERTETYLPLAGVVERFVCYTERKNAARPRVDKLPPAAGE